MADKLETVMQLMDYEDIDANVISDLGELPLYTAIKYDLYPIANLLLESGKMDLSLYSREEYRDLLDDMLEYLEQAKKAHLECKNDTELNCIQKMIDKLSPYQCNGSVPLTVGALN